MHRLLFTALACLVSVSVFGQTCTANYDFGTANFGISPDASIGETLEDGQVGVSYSDDIHFLWPTYAVDLDTTLLPLPETLELDSIELVSITMSYIGFPDITYTPEELGLEISCNNQGDSGNPCSFLSNNQYCVSIEGVPNTSGEYMFTMTFIGWIGFQGFPVSQEVSYDGITLEINNNDYGCTDSAACNYNPSVLFDDGSCEFSNNCFLLFYEDFSNGFAGSNEYGSWTTEDNANNNIWVYVGSDGFGTYSSGNATGVQHPGGEYSNNIGTLDSETFYNGWMIFDNDFFNTPTSEGYQDTNGSLISPVIDFSDAGSVILSWQQYFRYCCYPYAPIYVDVTNDGGATWTTFDAHGSFIESANTASANPLPTSLDISCVAAYQSEVQIRFTYTQAPETGNGYSHYYW